MEWAEDIKRRETHAQTCTYGSGSVAATALIGEINCIDIYIWVLLLYKIRSYEWGISIKYVGIHLLLGWKTKQKP